MNVRLEALTGPEMNALFGIAILAIVLVVDFLVFRRLGVVRYFMLVAVALLVLNYLILGRYHEYQSHDVPHGHGSVEYPDPAFSLIPVNVGRGRPAMNVTTGMAGQASIISYPRRYGVKQRL